MFKEGKKRKLSKSILQMKFMKKSKEKAEKEQDDEEAKAMYADILPKEIRNAQSRFILEPSYIHCKDLVEGRFSFQGMNPEIERLMDFHNEDSELSNSQNEKDVSDNEMAERYDIFSRNDTNFAGPLAFKKYTKRFKITKEINTKNMKFIKPSD